MNVVTMAATLATNSTSSTSSSSSITQNHNKANTSTNRLIIKNAYENDMNNNYTYDFNHKNYNNNNNNNNNNNTSDATNKHNLIKFNLGDLVWVKLNNHPWWPCAITSDNTVPNNCFYKLIDNTSVYYYVELFGYLKERAWASSNDMFAFDGIESFKKYAQNQVDQAPTKQDKEKLAERFQLKVSMSKRKQWDNAVELADKHANKLKSLKRKREHSDDMYENELINAIKKQQVNNEQHEHDEDESSEENDDDDENDDEDEDESMQPTSIYEYDQPVQYQILQKTSNADDDDDDENDDELEKEDQRTKEQDGFQIKSEPLSQTNSQRKVTDAMSKTIKKEKGAQKREDLKTSKQILAPTKNVSSVKHEPIEQVENKPNKQFSLKIKPLAFPNPQMKEKKAKTSKKSQTLKRSSSSSESSSGSSSSSASSSAYSSSTYNSSGSSSCESSNEEDESSKRDDLANPHHQSQKQLKQHSQQQLIDVNSHKLTKKKGERKKSKSTMNLFPTALPTTNHMIDSNAMSSNNASMSTNKSKQMNNKPSGQVRKRNMNKSTSGDSTTQTTQHGNTKNNSYMTNILIQNNINNMIGSNASGSGTTETYLIDRYKYAVRHIKQGLSIEEACNKYRISKGALLKCLSGGTAPRGKKTRLSESEENEIVEWLINDRDLKYNDAIHLVFEKVVHIFKQAQRPNPFNNGRPSMDWWYDFLSRHPQIMASKPDWLMRGKVNDQYIKDVQSGQLKCTKFRRALLSAIQYIQSMNDSKANLAPSSSSSSSSSSSVINNFNSHNENKSHKLTLNSSNSSKSSHSLSYQQNKAMNRSNANNNHTRQQIQSSSSTILSSDKKKRRLTMNSLSSSMMTDSSSVHSSQLSGQTQQQQHQQQQLYSQPNNSYSTNGHNNHGNNMTSKQIKGLHYKQAKFDASDMLGKASDALDCSTANIFENNDEFFASTKNDEALLSTHDLIDADFHPSGHHHHHHHHRQEDENESSFDSEFLNVALNDNNNDNSDNNNHSANHFDDIIDPIDHHAILNSIKHHANDANHSAFNLNKYANDLNCLKLNNNMNSIHHGNHHMSHLSPHQQHQQHQHQQQLQLQPQSKLGHHNHFNPHHTGNNSHMSHLIITDNNEDENGHEQVSHDDHDDDYHNDIENHHHHHNHHNAHHLSHHSHHHHHHHHNQLNSNMNSMPVRLLNNSLTTNLDEEDEEYIRNTIDPSAFLP